MLQKTRLLANQRLDLQDYNNIEDFICADLKAIHKNVWTSQNFVYSGFTSSGIGTNTLSIVQANSSLIIGQNDGVLFIGAPSLSPLSTTSLSPGTTNYVEISITQDTGGADSRAFWDATAAGGAGAEFSQIVDTFIFLKSELNISTSNFSGDPDKVKICEVDVNSSGVITSIRDSRNLFWRLGRSSNTSFSYPWASRIEPTTTSFTGADKDIATFKQWADAVMDAVKEIKGVTHWYELANVSLTGAFRNTGLSILTAATSSARFSWSGSALSITDDNGSPADSDVLAYIRLFDSSANLGLTRQQSGQAISISDGQVLWVELPSTLATTSYDSVGATATNYRVTNRGSLTLNQTVYWLAYREGNKLYLRGLGELEAGEARQIDDETTRTLATLLGFNPETATSVAYTSTPSGSLPDHFTSSSDLVTAISANTGNINYLNSILNGTPYEEMLAIISGSPSSTNEFTGPVSSGTILSLPLDSRDSNSTEYYIVGKGQIEVYLNGDYLDRNSDWSEVGASNSQSTTITINIGLVVGDKITFRNALVGGVVFVSGGGGGSASLQDAYDNGASIAVTAGQPVTFDGPSGYKLAQFNGDIGVTGVIDPAGITFVPQSSTPLANDDHGLWINDSGELIHSTPSQPDTNITQAITTISEGQTTALTLDPQLSNQTGQLLAKLKPVRVNNLGYLDAIDVSIEAQALAAIGLVKADISTGTAGSVVTHGLLENITTSASYGDVLYVSKTGGITNVQPSIGSGSFVSGDFVIRLGVVSRNVSTPSLKDLIVSVTIVGQL